MKTLFFCLTTIVVLSMPIKQVLKSSSHRHPANNGFNTRILFTEQKAPEQLREFYPNRTAVSLLFGAIFTKLSGNRDNIQYTPGYLPFIYDRGAVLCNWCIREKERIRHKILTGDSINILQRAIS